jgi:hypothetical protein
VTDDHAHIFHNRVATKYVATRDGAIINLESTAKLTTRSDGRGYLCVSLWIKGKAYTHKVHRLVWSAFHGPIPQGYHVDHIDHDKTNNRLTNLRIRPAGENSADCRRGPTQGRRRHHPDTMAAAAVLRREGWPPHRIMLALGVGETTVRRWVNSS